MKPSICFLCGKPYKYEEENSAADEVYFLNYKAHGEFALTDPDGLEYFCNEHIAAAKALAHMTSEDALLELHQQFGYPKYKHPPIKLSWWNKFLLWIGYW